MPWYLSLFGGWLLIFLAILGPLAIWTLYGVYGKFDSREDRKGWRFAAFVALMLSFILLLGDLMRSGLR